MKKSHKIVVLDAGGQYCHLIARKVRELGVYAEIEACSASAQKLEDYQGIIISGGPASVYSYNKPKIDPEIFNLGVPVLGICYGHQVMTEALGGKVQKGKRGEYGIAQLSVLTGNTLFKNITMPQQVWMSHRDVVENDSIPPGFKVIGETNDCQVAAMANFSKRLYGLQFHPEVVHTEKGKEILSNFVFNICKCSADNWKPSNRIAEFVSQIRKIVGEKRNVFFLVSGGVDSTVAFTLCVKALGKDRVQGLYIDTGFMRKYDTEAIRDLIASGIDNIHMVDASREFLDMLKSTWSPEQKRKKIGKKFLELTEHILENELQLSKDDWVLGQGTIYPDTIESGGSKHAAHIKTHHNRVSIIRRLIQEGKVVEPLHELYKDEVREVGLKLSEELNLPKRLIFRHPFPGPGLAIRCLVSRRNLNIDEQLDDHLILQKIASEYNLKSGIIPLRTVGVKGDERSYDSVALLLGRIPSTGAENIQALEQISTSITNNDVNINRVTYCLTHSEIDFRKWQVQKSSITPERVELLREADNLVMRFMEKHNLLQEVWQFPVVLIPFGQKTSEGETIVLRPVDSIDGMTAHFSRLDVELLRKLAQKLKNEIHGIDAVLIDITNKPPATIEWE